MKIEKTVVSGMPDISRISTSHVEKQNHTLRMHCRRLTRLTNAFSKKLENFEAAVSLNFAYYNFCKIHGAIRCTPAMAAGVESSQWSVAELSNVVANKQYIERLQMALNHLHGCEFNWAEAVPVHEVFRGQTVWRGIVEVFDLTGIPKAKRAYGWSHKDRPKDQDERFVTVLGNAASRFGANRRQSGGHPPRLNNEGNRGIFMGKKFNSKQRDVGGINLIFQSGKASRLRQRVVQYAVHQKTSAPAKTIPPVLGKLSRIG